jgi:chromosome segregation ATPase
MCSWLQQTLAADQSEGPTAFAKKGAGGHAVNEQRADEHGRCSSAQTLRRMTTRGRLGGQPSLTAAYSRPLSMEEVFDRLMQLERAHADERTERQRIEQQLDEERAARKALEHELSGRLRGMEIAASSGSGWKGELAGLREDMSASGDAAQKQLDDHKDSLNAILEVLEDTVTHEHMETTVAAVRAEIAEQGASSGAGDAASGEELEELAGALEELDERVSGLAHNLESVVDEVGETETGLATRLAKVEGDVVAAVAAADGIDATITRGMQKFEAKSAQLDQMVEGHVEEELRGFAQSFRLAVTRIDQVVQQLDKKIEQSVGSIATRLSEENGMLDEQIGRVAQSVEDALVEAQHKLENLAADIQQFVLQVGRDKVTAEQIATSTAARVEDLHVDVSRLRVEVEETEHKLRVEIANGDNALRGEVQAARLSSNSSALAAAGSRS